MWDFALTNNTLTICYPDGLTTITTKSDTIVRRFKENIGYTDLNDDDMNALLKSFAGMMLAKASKPKPDQYAMRNNNEV